MEGTPLSQMTGSKRTLIHEDAFGGFGRRGNGLEFWNCCAADGGSLANGCFDCHPFHQRLFHNLS
jgi:hypothetical protein